MGVSRPGRVVLLNGPSSSGKSVPLDEEALAEVLARTRRGYHRVVAALAEAGNDVVMDYPLSEPWRLADLLEVLQRCDVTLVDVRCAPEELEWGVNASVETGLSGWRPRSRSSPTATMTSSWTRRTRTPGQCPPHRHERRAGAEPEGLRQAAVSQRRTVIVEIVGVLSRGTARDLAAASSSRSGRSPQCVTSPVPGGPSVVNADENTSGSCSSGWTRLATSTAWSTRG